MRYYLSPIRTCHSEARSAEESAGPSHIETAGGDPIGHQLKFRRLMDGPYAVLRFAADAAVPDWTTRGEFTSITRTTEELSVVCPADNLPSDVHSLHRWICLKLQGPFEFSLTGVLLSFIEPLSSNGIPIFAISTYDTDYVLIQEEFWGMALNALQYAGHVLVDGNGSSAGNSKP